jgi:hypothetical protein
VINPLTAVVGVDFYGTSKNFQNNKLGVHYGDIGVLLSQAAGLGKRMTASKAKQI